MTAPGRRAILARTILAYGVTALLLILGLWYANAHQQDLAVLRQLGPGQLLTLAACMAAFFVITGVTNKLLLAVVSVRLRAIEWLTLPLLGQFANYLLPTRPGAAVKAVYLKATHTVPYARFLAVLAAHGLLILFSSGTLGLLLLLSMWIETGIFSWTLAAVFLAIIGLAVLPLIVRLRSLPGVSGQGRLARISREAITGFETFRSQGRMLLAVSASLLCQYLAVALFFTAAYRMLGIDVGFHAALMAGVFTAIAAFFTITPSNLGIQELMIAYLYSTIGLDFTSGLIGAGLFRALHIALTFGLTPILTYALMHSAGIPLGVILRPGRSRLPDELPPSATTETTATTETSSTTETPDTRETL